MTQSMENGKIRSIRTLKSLNCIASVIVEIHVHCLQTIALWDRLHVN